MGILARVIPFEAGLIAMRCGRCRKGKIIRILRFQSRIDRESGILHPGFLLAVRLKRISGASLGRFSFH